MSGNKNNHNYKNKIHKTFMLRKSYVHYKQTNHHQASHCDGGKIDLLYFVFPDIVPSEHIA